MITKCKTITIPPKNDETLLVFTRRFLEYVGKRISGTPPDWSHLSKDVPCKAIAVFLNDFVRKNSHVTREDFENLGMTVTDKIKTTIHDPGIECEADVAFPGVGLVELFNFHPVRDPLPNEAAAYHGVSIHYGLMGPPNGKDKFRLTEVPLTGDDLPHHEFTRKQSFTLKLQGESGNKLFICLRYENAKGGKGPWGRMIVVNIP